MDESAAEFHLISSLVATPIAARNPSDRVRLKQFDATHWADSQYEYVRHQYYGWRGTVLEEYDWRQSYRPIGRGGFGAVHRQECIRGSSQGEVRAVKTLTKPDTAHFTSIDYGRELEVIARFSQSQYARYFVQSPGCLSQHIGTGLPETQVQIIVAQVLQGLSYMHAAGYTHRDLKPQNLLVVHAGPAWHVKLADFVLTKRISESVSSRRGPAGTPGYMAPEMVILDLHYNPDDSDFSDNEPQHHYTNAVDIWAVGVISFLLLTGNLPFPAQSSQPLKKYARGKAAFPIEALKIKQVSQAGCTILPRLMASYPSERPSASSILQDTWLNMAQDTRQYAEPPKECISAPHTITRACEASSRARPSLASATWSFEGSGQKTLVPPPLPLRPASSSRISSQPSSMKNDSECGPQIGERHSLPTIRSKDMMAELVGEMKHIAGLSPFEQSNYVEAQQLFEESWSEREASLGTGHPKTLESKFMLAKCLLRRFQYADAEPMFREVLHQWEEVLGKSHRNTLDCREELGLLLTVHSEIEASAEAEQLLRGVVAGRRAVLGTKHEDTLRSITYLAEALTDAQCWQEATLLFRDVVRDQEETLGADHRMTLISKFDLARALQGLDKDEEADILFQELEKKREALVNICGKVPQCGKWMLAVVLNQLERFDEAVPLWREVVKEQQAVLGLMHIVTTESKLSLASCMSCLCKFEEADPLLREVEEQTEAQQYPPQILKWLEDEKMYLEREWP